MTTNLKHIKQKLFASLAVSLVATIFVHDIPLVKKGNFFIVVFVLIFLPSLLFKEKIKNPVCLVFLWLFMLVLLRGSTLIATGVIEERGTCSMVHTEKNFGRWWELNEHKYKNISKEEFLRFPFPNGKSVFDSRRVKKAAISELKTGDIVVYWSEFHENRISLKIPFFPVLISHRLVGKKQENGTTFLELLGDDNQKSEFISTEQIRGKLIEGFNPFLSLYGFLYHDPCKQIFAFLPPDRYFCKKVNNECDSVEDIEAKRAGCFRDISELTSPEQCCSLHPDRKDACYFHFAVASQNSAFCDFINTAVDGRINTFYGENLPCWKKRPITCKHEFTYRDGCYKKISLMTRDLALCDYIRDGYEKAECMLLTSRT